MVIFFTFFVFLLGICVGSFLNVCVWRIPRGESIVSPPSHCPKCDHSIRWYENIPLLSWLCLRGKCSKCKEPISSRYFCVELLTGVLFLLVWFRVINLGLPVALILPAFALFATTVMLMVMTSFIDLDHRLIPNKVTYPSMAFGFIWAILYPGLWHAKGSFAALSFACASAAVFGLSLAIFAVVGKKIFKKDALGWGDVKYVVAIAALLGPKAAFVTVLAGSIIGAVVGVGVIIVKKKDLKVSIPFGPCLAAGTLIWMLRGRELVAAYWRLTQHLR